MSRKELLIEGARQNNLKNISLSLPHNRVIAVTGVSGSGKSSLAFDTIFAEGQWRFIESLSTYARLFLEKLDRPDVDAIHNIRPAIALEQKNPVRGSRSTVATLTELYELFRLLYAKIAVPFCPGCGREIRKWDPSQIVSELVGNHSGERAIITFSSGEQTGELIKKGFHRVWLDGQIVDNDATLKTQGSGLDVVLDRVIIRDEPRLSDSVELAWKEGKGRIKVIIFRDQGTGGKGRGSEIRSQESEVRGQETAGSESRIVRPQTDPPGRANHESRATGAEDARFAVLLFSSENACEECGIELPEPSAILFSFNHPVGACPECKGFGNTLRYEEDLIIPDKSLSLGAGAVDPWNKPAARWWKKQLLKQAGKAGLDINKPYAAFSQHEKDLLFSGGSGFYGIHDFFEELEDKKYKLHVRVFLSRYRGTVTCPSCKGKRLKKEALAYRISGCDIADLARMSITAAVRFFEDLQITLFQRDVAKELLRLTALKLGFLIRVGLEYLTLDRYGKTLSGGEYQRINLSNQLASQLTGTMYVLDEPTVGLHARDTERISGIMKQLADLGNTVIVVEHDRSIIESSQWVVELGPGGGHRGGEVVFSGPAEEFLRADTLTARFMRGEEEVTIPFRAVSPFGKSVRIINARGNNLKGVDLEIPLRKFVVVSGVSGSGKSSLVVETLYRALAMKFRTDTEIPLPHDRIEGGENLRAVKLVDQSPIGKSPRSNPVTYLKIFDPIRKLFAEQREAKAYGYGPGFFSFNVPGGRCETCRGEGYELMEMYFFENLYITCEKCNGKRYRPEALRIQYRGKSIYDVLQMTAEEAAVLFADHPLILPKLNLMIETGLGYLRLGQPATTLSGGEAQRLKICAEIGTARKGSTLYILDEPTVGLHFADVRALLMILYRLVEAGNTVAVIEHNLDVIRAADWIIDIGPEGGDRGGQIVFAGMPGEIVRSDASLTGKYLAGL